MAENKYSNHPQKGEIDKRIDNGDSVCSINKWLLGLKDPNLALSIPTLSKIRKRRQSLPGSVAPKVALRGGLRGDVDSKIKQLWSIVKVCDALEKKMSDKITITSIKDWQYVNQQKQEALKLIAEIQGEKASDGDISIVLTKIFAKIEKTEAKDDETVIDAALAELGGTPQLESIPVQDKVS